VASVIEAQSRRATSLLEHRRKVLAVAAEQLLAHEVLSGDELRAIATQVPEQTEPPVRAVG